jgi:hypothetical protein
VVGGESMDEQFEMISSNPDVYACLSLNAPPIQLI